MKPKFLGLQLLRFVAAMMVVLMHTTEAISNRIAGHSQDGQWGVGSAGVDIFFVISGFVMSISTPEYTNKNRLNFIAAWQFMKRRILRITPLYWFYTALKMISVLAFPLLALKTTLVPQHVIASFLFFPVMSPWGLIQPVLPVGWSLCFEMFFYVLFALSIAFHIPRLPFCIFGFAIIYALEAAFPDSVALSFYAQSIIFEFVLGLIVARLICNRHNFSPALGLLIVGLGAIMVFGITWTKGTDRFLTWGTGAGLLVLGAALLEGSSRFQQIATKLSLLGDMSYSTYLCHTFIVPASVVSLGLLGIHSTLLIIITTLAAVILGSLFSYFYIELPMNNYLKKHFSNSKQS